MQLSVKKALEAWVLEAGDETINTTAAQRTQAQALKRQAMLALFLLEGGEDPDEVWEFFLQCRD